MEFERDTLTERIVDNMMELAKDGRWLGGNTPMGFTVRRVTTGSGKGKSAYSYLESLPEEKCMVQRLYEIFRTTRSIQTTAKQMNEEGFHTPSGAAFNASTTRLVLRNPIYCTADKRSYDYFIDHDGNVFGDMTEFDGTHGLSAYNKTDQEKFEGSDSTFISPKYVQTIESKPISKWIIAVGRHEGFISSEQWVEVQELLDAIAEKYNRPHRKTNALLAGLVHCSHCDRRLSVVSESDRWTNGKPRFKYVCPGYRKKECNFKAVDGVLLDEFVVQQLSDLSDENSERFKSILEIKIEEVLEQSQTVQEHNLIKKKRDKLKADIAVQTRNLREADGSIKQFIQKDLQNLAEELRETEQQISKLDEGRKNNLIAIRDLEMTKERLLSFAEYAKDAQPEVLVTLIQTIVERIYIVDKDDERYCHIFIKGCSGEDYTGFFRTAGYIENISTSVCDSEQYSIGYLFVVGALFAVLFLNQNILLQQYMDDIGLNVALFGVIFFIYNLITAFVSKRSGKLEGIFGKHTKSIFTLLIAVCFVVAGICRNYIGIVFLSLCRISIATINPIMDAEVNEQIDSAHRATLLSCYNALSTVADSVVSPFIGITIEELGIFSTYIIMGLASIFLFFIY